MKPIMSDRPVIRNYAIRVYEKLCFLIAWWSLDGSNWLSAGCLTEISWLALGFLPFNFALLL